MDRIPDEIFYQKILAFLYSEARLLDEWRLDEWEGLFTDTGQYLIAPLDSADPESANPSESLFIVADDRMRISQRVGRLMKDSAYAERPRSRTRHCISNVEILTQSDSVVEVSSISITYRIRRGVTTTYIGRTIHILAYVGNAFRIIEKRVCLDLDILAPHGAVSIIL